MTSNRFIQVLTGPSAGSLYPLGDIPLTIGRSADADVPLQEIAVSRTHGRVVSDDEGDVWFEDLNSRNGSFMGGQRVQRCKLNEGDIINLGGAATLKYARCETMEAELIHTDAAPRDATVEDSQAASTVVISRVLPPGIFWSRASCRLYLYTLGRFEVVNDGHAIDERAWKTRKTRQLFAYLVTERAHEVSDELLLNLFWPETLDLGRKSLNTAIYHIRSCMRRASEDIDPIVRGDGTVRLNPQYPIWHDLEELRAWDRLAANQTRLQARGAALRRMASLYAGPYLDGVYADWAERIRQDVGRRMAEIWSELAEDARTAEDYHSCLKWAAKTLDVSPLNHHANLLVMQAHRGMGNPEQSIKHFEKCSAMLRREPGSDVPITLVEECLRARLVGEPETIGVVHGSRTSEANRDEME